MAGAKFPLIVLKLLAFLQLIVAQQIVQVGYQGLQYGPNTIFANVGSQVEFQFVAPGHDVVQGSYTTPCMPGGNTSFFSGANVAVGNSFTITVNNSNPIWFYCSTIGHCQGGMIGVINPPASDQTLDGYQGAAANAPSSSQPASVEGGVIGTVSSTTSSTSVSPSGTSSTTSTAPASTATKKSEGMMVRGSTFLGVAGVLAAWLM